MSRPAIELPIEYDTNLAAVETCLKYFKDTYQSLEAAQNLRAVSLRLIKSSKFAQHEYILVDILDTSRRDKRYSICLQRGRGVPAFGSIHWLAPGQAFIDSNNIHCSTIEFPANDKTHPLFHYNLVILACVIHWDSPQYMLFTQNCYFLAGTIFEFWDGDVTKEDNIPANVKEGSWYSVIKTWVNNDKSGGLSAHMVKLKSNYEEALEAFKNVLRERVEAQEQQKQMWQQEGADREQQALKEQMEVQAKQMEVQAKQLEVQARQLEAQSKQERDLQKRVEEVEEELVKFKQQVV
ncbi:hypothetical protein H0H87_002713 [Tephrocybe sp. NHM501043]|nr:hypothetical protein H0H87_002713 [Tephrocybe sp. NHM501043]